MKRNFWPYAIILYFVVFITAMTTWIVFAMRNDHELVRKDYYEQDLKFQQNFESAARARELGVKIDYDAVNQRIAIAMPASAPKGTIHFYRPSQASLDRSMPLDIVGGKQSIDVRLFQSGRWKVKLAWSVGGVEYQCEETIQLQPAQLSAL